LSYSTETIGPGNERRLSRVISFLESLPNRLAAYAPLSCLHPAYRPASLTTLVLSDSDIRAVAVRSGVFNDTTLAGDERALEWWLRRCETRQSDVIFLHESLLVPLERVLLELGGSPGRIAYLHHDRQLAGHPTPPSIPGLRLSRYDETPKCVGRLDRFYGTHYQVAWAPEALALGPFFVWEHVRNGDIVSAGGPQGLWDQQVTLGHLYTLPDYRGRGLASAVLDQLLHEYKGRRSCEVGLFAEADNENALALYRRQGFQPAGSYYFVQL